MFSWRNKKNIMWIPPLICSYDFIPQLAMVAQSDACPTGDQVTVSIPSGSGNILLED